MTQTQHRPMDTGEFRRHDGTLPDPQSAARRTVQWASGTNIVAGAWLLFAPFVLGVGDVTAAVWNGILVGLTLLSLAWYRTANPGQGIGASWTNAALGGWLLFAPFALGVGSVAAAAANGIIVGLIVLTAAITSAVAGRKLQTSM
ncbi:MAG: SPW repeat protein [Actinobacteria bacterium]|nr:SPW repeat protein [Actinomycetota bacterium]